MDFTIEYHEDVDRYEILHCGLHAMLWFENKSDALEFCEELNAGWRPSFREV